MSKPSGCMKPLHNVGEQTVNNLNAYLHVAKAHAAAQCLQFLILQPFFHKNLWEVEVDCTAFTIKVEVSIS